MNRLSRASQRRVGDDAGFAMIMTIFLIVIMVITTATVATIVIQQVKPTNLAKKQIRTVDAASGGMQAALGQLRATQGDLTALPCSDPSDSGGVTALVGTPAQSVTLPGDQITGTVSSTPLVGNQATYRTIIVYFTTDPTAHETDTSTSWWTANAVACKAGLVRVTPTYAFIESFGAGGQVTGLSTVEGDRTQFATYQFSTTTTNITGGRLAEFNSGAQDSMCLDAMSAEPTAGTVPEMEPCLALGTPEQTWEYRGDLSIQYGGDTSLNLCIQNVSASPSTAGTAQLKTCSSATGTGTTYPYANNTQQEQEWAYNDGGQLQAADTAGNLSTGSPLCLDGAGVTTSTPAVANALLSVVSCSGSSTNYTAWNPDPQMGAGKSGSNYTGLPGSPTNQYVNFAMFGRCLDVSGQTWSHNLIAYPCKQAPNSGALAWNELWTYQSVSGGYGIFYDNCPAGASCVSGSGSAEKDCLASPGTANGAVYGVVCPTNGVYPSNLLWNATGAVANNYLQSYLLINQSDGRCMAADPGTLEPNSGVPEIVVTNCDGTAVPTGGPSNYLLLKWNAPPNPPAGGLGNVQEGGATLNTG